MEQNPIAPSKLMHAPPVPHSLPSPARSQVSQMLQSESASVSVSVSASVSVSVSVSASASLVVRAESPPLSLVDFAEHPRVRPRATKRKNRLNMVVSYHWGSPLITDFRVGVRCTEGDWVPLELGREVQVTQLESKRQVVWVDIPCVELDRTLEFYPSAFDLKVNVETFGDFKMGILAMAGAPSEPASFVSPESVGSDKGLFVYMNCDGRLADAESKGVAAGGERVQSIHEIAPHGSRPSFGTVRAVASAFILLELPVRSGYSYCLWRSYDEIYGGWSLLGCTPWRVFRPTGEHR
jgi:predicted enzyme related to lactoylglutathione lyase